MRMRTLLMRLSPAALVLLLAIPAGAQTTYGSSQATVSSTDIQRLQDQVYEAGSDISRMRSRDAASADRLQSQLDDARDEVVYLKVKMRKEGSVSRSDYNDVRDRIQNIRSQARGEAASGSPSADRSGNSTWSTNTSPSQSGSGTYGGTVDQQSSRPPRRGEIPAGQEKIGRAHV